MSARDEGVFVVVLEKTEATFPRVLLQLRKNTGLHDGKFAFPGGKRNSNEPVPQAAVRELYEETGLEVSKTDLQYLCCRRGKDRNGAKWRGIFFCFYADKLYSGKDLAKNLVKEPSKHDRVEWYSIDKLPENIAPLVLEVISDFKIKTKLRERGRESHRNYVRKRISKIAHAIAILLKASNRVREVLI